MERGMCRFLTARCTSSSVPILSASMRREGYSMAWVISCTLCGASLVDDPICYECARLKDEVEKTVRAKRAKEAVEAARDAARRSRDHEGEAMSRKCNVAVHDVCPEEGTVC